MGHGLLGGHVGAALQQQLAREQRAVQGAVAEGLGAVAGSLGHGPETIRTECSLPSMSAPGRVVADLGRSRRDRSRPRPGRRARGRSDMLRAMTGLIERYRERLPFGPDDPVVSLSEGSTPLVLAPRVSERAGTEVWLKLEGANPTGSFKDRGMTCAVSAAMREGAHAVICASTGNTAASAAAYAARAGLRCAVIVPEGKIATGKLAQALMHGARVIALRGNFDEALKLVRELANRHPIALVNSVNEFRIEGQKTAAFELVEALEERARRALHPGRQRRQHHRVLARVQRSAPNHPTANDARLSGGGRRAAGPRRRRSRTLRRSRARSGSATRRAGRRRWMR